LAASRPQNQGNFKGNAAWQACSTKGWFPNYSGQINVRAVFAATQAAARHMKAGALIGSVVAPA
jgi:hypothetical protein